MLIPGGMHVQSLKKGDVVLNANQTASLLKSGKAFGNGKAYASGTAYNMMPAHSSPAGISTGGNTMLSPSGIRPTSVGNTPGNNNYNKYIKADTTATQQHSSAMSKSTQVLDWVARRLQYFADKTKEIADTISDYVSYEFANKQLNKQIKAVQKEKNANANGYVAYMAKANSVRYTETSKDKKGKTVSKEVELSDKYKNLVESGAWKKNKWKIQDMDTSTENKKALYDAIQKYQEYYDKAQACAEATRELTQTEKELRVQRLENIAANYDGKAHLKASRISNIQSSMDVDNATGKKVGTTATKNSTAYKEKRTNIKSNLKSLQSEEDTLSNLKLLLTDRLKNSKGKNKLNIQSQIADVNSQLSQNKAQQKSLRNQLKITPDVEKKQYQAMVKASQGQENLLAQKKKDVSKEFDKLVANGTIKKNSSEWYKWKEEIAGIDDEINQCKVDQAEWNETIANLPIDKLKDANENLQTKAGGIQRKISIKEAAGNSASEKDYRSLISNSSAQNKNLEQQNKLLIKQRNLYDVGTDKWKEYQSQIDANTEAIDNNIQSMIEWTNNILNLPFEKRDAKLENNQNKRDVYDSRYDVAQTSTDKNKILYKQDALAKSDVKIYQDAVGKAESNVTKMAQKAVSQGLFDTKANRGKAVGDKLSLDGLKVNSDAYKAAVNYNNALDKQAQAEREAEIAANKATKSIQDNAKARFDNTVAGYEGDLNLNASKQGVTQSLSNRAITNGTISKYSTKYLNDTLKEQNDALAIQQTQLKKAKKSYDKNKANMSEEDRKAAETTINDLQAKVYDTQASIAETNKSIKNMPLEQKQDDLKKLEVTAGKLQDKLSMKEAKGLNATAKDYNKLIANSDKQVENLEAQNKELEKQKEGLRSDSEEYLKLQEQIDANDSAIRSAEQSQVEWNNAIANIPLDKIQKALDKLDALGALYESANNLKSKLGEDLTVEDYETEIQNNIDKIAQEEKNISKYSQYGEFAQMETYAKKAKDSGKAFNGKTYTEWMTDYYNALKEQGLNNGKKFDDWLTDIEKEGLDGKFNQKSFTEWNTEIDKTKTNINNLKIANEDLKDSKRDDVFWRDFERAHEAAQRLKDDIDGIAGLISDDMVFDADGKLTDFGLSKVATNVKDLEIARGEVQNYTNDIANLNKLYAEGEYTEEEYKKKLAELKNGVLDSASAMKAATDAIVDMYKSMGQAELDSLFEVIDARKEALTAKKSYYDYDKSLKAKNKNIQSLKAEIAALEGIATASSKAELAKKRAELADAQGELDDMIVDHQMELSQTALDGMKESLQDAFDDKWQDMHSDLGAIADLMDSANTLVKSSASDINVNLGELLKHYGIDPVLTGVDPTNVTKHASGAKRVGYNGFGITQEAGREIVLKDGSVLLPLKASDGIIPNQLTENLFKIAKEYPFMNASVPQTITPIVNIESNGGGGNITYHFDSLITVEGNLDSVTGKQVIDIIKTQMPNISKFTQKEIVRDAGRNGIRF